MVLVAQNYSGRAGTVTVRQMAALGSSLAMILNVLSLVAVLAIAPASTAGAICLDRTRGSLAHLFTTDLSDREIVLGKLAARLGPVLVLLAAAFPVAALATWLGGIDPLDLTSASLVIAGLAVLGSTLALMLSVWGSKPQEVLSVVYAIWAAWILALPVWQIATNANGPAILSWTNPFFLVLGHANHPADNFLRASALFGAACLILGGGFTTVAVRRVRVVACQSPRARTTRLDRPERTGGRRQTPRPRWWRPEASLDADPIYWREARRDRGSRWSRWIWRGFRAIGHVCGIYLVVSVVLDWGSLWNNQAPGLFLGALVVLGFLVIGAAVPAVLSDERVQGSLDVLLCAPVSTRSIVWAKWRGAFRRVPSLAGWPLVIGLLYLFHPLHWTARAIALLVPVAVVVQGAALVSLGLFLATVIRRTAAATAWTIGSLVVGVVALPILGAYLPLDSWIDPQDRYWAMLGEFAIAEGSPFMSTAFSLVVALRRGVQQDESEAILVLLANWTLVYAALAVGLFELTVRIFDRCLGRMPERSAGGATPPARASEARVGELLEREVDRLAVP